MHLVEGLSYQMKLLLLLCVFGVAVPADRPPHYDTIVVGLGAAGCAASAALARAGRRVLALEAQSHVGGRAHTVPFGDGVVEMGAEWIHGNESSITYDLATRYNISTTIQPLTIESYRSDGSAVDSKLATELFSLDFSEDLPDPPEPQGSFFTRKFTEYITKNKPDLLKDKDFMTEYLEFSNLVTDNLEGSNDWNDVTTGGSYESLGGPQAISWHRHGYKTLFEIMLNTYNGGPGLPSLTTKLATEVTRITVPRSPGEPVAVQCKDGSSYVADTAVLTVSLGVLKATHSTLFSPPLPKDKQTAIEKISMGVIVDKIILSFEEAWWPRNISVFGFIWKGGDRRKVAAADYWTTRIFAAHPPAGSSNTLTLWTSGEVAKEVELLPEDTVKTKCVELLQRFMGDTMKFTVPQPAGIIRSNWFSNPFTRGCYTYDNIQAPQHPELRARLGRPLADSSGAPRVLFSGEATNLRHFSTVHGAAETGQREAGRLLHG